MARGAGRRDSARSRAEVCKQTDMPAVMQACHQSELFASALKVVIYLVYYYS